MPATERRPPRAAQRGIVTTEVALLTVVFFMFVFFVLEVSRVLYVFNTLHEVTRRAAAAAVKISPSSAAELDAARQNAVFRSRPGTLPFGAPVSDQHVRIDYLALTRVGVDGAMSLSAIPAAALPASAAENRLICMGNPNASNCIRFVRVRICDTADLSACNAVAYQSLFPLVTLPLSLPAATTIAPAESLGYVQGMAP